MMLRHLLSHRLKAVLASVALMATPLLAQLNYLFTAQSGTYTELTGATDLNSIETDDAHSGNVSLGFTFNYEGTNVTQVRVNSNGWISMATGDSPSAAQGRDNSNMGSANANTRPALMPLWDDLSGAGATALYRTTGSAPNRVFTMEWRNWRWNYNANNAVISFQCKLYEGSNAIEFIYRRDNANVSSGSASIGILGSASGTFISLGSTGTNPPTSTSTATTNLNTKPATGQIYRFTPCTSPTATYGTPTTDCYAGTYTVPVNVTNLGTSGTVDIVASPGGTVYSGVGVGTYNVGPITLGSSLSVVVNGSAGCGTSLGSMTMNDPDGTCHAAAVYPIPDNGCASNNVRDIPFCLNSAGTQLGTDVFVRSVSVIASHSYNADLRLSLISPLGTTVQLVNNRFGSGDNLGNPGSCPGTTLTLRDDGSSLVNTNQNNVSGVYAPEQSLGGFNDGTDPNGTWTLRACDAANLDQGAIRYVRVDLCSPVLATLTPLPNCVNNQFRVAVNVTGFGSGSSASITYTVDGGSPTTVNGVGLGTTQIGPFPASTEVAVAVTNGLSGCGVVSGILGSNCPVMLDCGANLIVDHCYGNNSTRTFTYLSPIPGETVTINFVQGTLDMSDALMIYDGTDDSAPLINGGNFFGNLAGMSFMSSGSAIHMRVISNGSNSCADGGQGTPWNFEAKCTPGCQAPMAMLDIYNDCANYQFSGELMVMYAGDGIGNDVVYTVNGGTPNRISGVEEWTTVPLGPFAIGDQVQVIVEHADDHLCDLNMGTFTNTVSCPSADNCVNALNLATESSPLNGSTTGRTSTFSWNCGTTSNNTAPDAIYYIDVPADRQLNIRQRTNNYDSQHYVRFGGACPGTTAIACVDDDGGETAWVNWTNTTGTTQRVWWIQDGYGSNSGNFTLEWDITCPNTTATAATSVLSNSAYANFNGQPDSYIIEYGPANSFTTPGTGASPGTNGTVVTTNTSPFQLTGLSPSTQYRYFVRRVCDSGSYGANSNAITFTTAAGVSVPNGTCGQNRAIPDNGCGSNNTLNALISISGQNAQLGVNVALESVDLILTHTYRADIEMSLISPTGQSRNLILDRGGSGDNFGNNGNCPTAVFKLRDGGTALSTIGNSPNNVTGTYAPEQPLSGFTGDPNGTWTLRICDDAGSDQGALRFVRLNFQTIDCLGVRGGTTLPGAPCNDGNTCTINDVYTQDCQCQGTFLDTDNDGVCDANDGCPNDANKTTPGACGCGTADVATTWYADTDGDGAGDPLNALAGYTCIVPPGYVANATDDCPNDANKTTPGACGCGVPDTDTDGDGTADCNDGCPNDANKTSPGTCGCGVADTDTDGDGTPDCNDECPNDAGKITPGVCGCGSPDVDSDGDGVLDCNDSCPNLFGQVGSPCNDNNAGTVLDQITPGCQCQGVPCTEQLNFALDLDMHGSQISWEIAQSGTGTVICSGGMDMSYPDNAPFPLVESCCLPAGCYSLSVFDSAGDGISGGGYQLRESGSNGRRIIDNRGGFTTGFSSSIAGDQDFCVPVGDDKLIFSSCDKLDWVPNKFIVVVENPLVSAQYGQTNTTSGYEFWFFDPNGSYSYRRFRSHATSDGYGAAALRANHFKINGWSNNATTPHIPANKLLNVRVRSRVAGVNLPFGQACLFKIDEALAVCPRVKLQDNPSIPDDFSCGVIRNFGGSSNPNNRIYAAPPQPVPSVLSSNVRYQFRFRIPGEGICIVRPPQTSAQLVLNWTNGPALQATKTYDVDVRVSLDAGSTWCYGPAASAAAAACADGEDWGKVCLVTIAGGQAQGGGSHMAATDDGQHERSVVMFPNPNNGTQLFLALSGPVEEGATTMNVDIYDMAGKRVMARTIAAPAGPVNTTIELNGELQSGVYLVHLTTGTLTRTGRLVIQR